MQEPAPVDPRAVQSMPHGMFGKCLAEEEALQSKEAPSLLFDMLWNHNQLA